MIPSPKNSVSKKKMGNVSCRPQFDLRHAIGLWVLPHHESCVDTRILKHLNSLYYLINKVVTDSSLFVENFKLCCKSYGVCKIRVCLTILCDVSGIIEADLRKFIKKKFN